MKTPFTNARTFGRKIADDPSSFTLQGLCCAVHTALNDDMTLNLSLIATQAKQLVAEKCTGVFVCGTAGESLALNITERKSLIDEWVKQGHANGLCVIIHIGDEVLTNAQELCKYAYEKGVDAVALVPPRFFAPPCLDNLVDWVARVASAAPELPVYYYHLDVINYTPYPMNKFLEICSKRIPNLCGMKFTDYNSFVLGLCLEVEDYKYNVLMGREDAMLAAVATGCVGFVGASFSLVGKNFSELLDAWAANDLETARLHMKRGRDFSKILFQSGNKYMEGASNITIDKAIWTLIGYNYGPDRILRKKMTPEKLALLKNDLEAIGFWDWSSFKCTYEFPKCECGCGKTIDQCDCPASCGCACARACASSGCPCCKECKCENCTCPKGNKKCCEQEHHHAKRCHKE
ncbi:hypothetical protein WA158_002036 [Blastocystis sp. Blastoise]